MRLLRTVLAAGTAAAAAAALSACGGGTSTTSTYATTAPAGEKGEYGGGAGGGANTINVTMAAQNGSKQTGTATVSNSTNKARSGNVQVTITLSNEPKGASEPAHIHDGTCAKLNPVPDKPLTNVVNGKSVTTVTGITVAELQKEKYAINVHKSAADLKTYVSCGNL